MIMRADGVLRVMLNTPIFKGMTVGDGQGKEPKSKQINLASLESGRSVPILLRVSHPSLPTTAKSKLTDPRRPEAKISPKNYTALFATSRNTSEHEHAIAAAHQHVYWIPLKSASN